MSSARYLYSVLSKYLYAGIFLIVGILVLVRGERFSDADGPHVLPTLMCILFGLTTGITALVMMLGNEETQNQC